MRLATQSSWPSLSGCPLSYVIALILHRFALVLLAAALLWPFAAASQPTVDGYTTQTVHGFNVLMNNADVAAHATQMQAALDEVDAQLLAITQSALPAAALASLKDVKIFVDRAQTTGGAQYHPSRQWLIDNGYNPEKEKSVEISNAVNFVNWSQQNQPWMLLHELAHAYHDQVLGYDHVPTTAAYENARDSGILDAVLYNPGGGQALFEREAYAKNNSAEYLAEITEAYFGENDFYPFLKSELATYDPQGFALVESVWGVNSATSTERDPVTSPFAVYPNPVIDVLSVEAPVATDVFILDMMGRVLATTTTTSGTSRVDVSHLPAGTYLVRFQSDAGPVVRRVLRVR